MGETEIDWVILPVMLIGCEVSVWPLLDCFPVTTVSAIALDFVDNCEIPSKPLIVFWTVGKTETEGRGAAMMLIVDFELEFKSMMDC